MQFNQNRQRDMRRAQLHSATGDGIQHPRRYHDNDTGRDFYMDDFAVAAPLAILPADMPPIKCVPAVMDLNFLPDMGRMTVRLRSGAAPGSSPAPTAGGERAAAMYTLIATAKPRRMLTTVLDAAPCSYRVSVSSLGS